MKRYKQRRFSSEQRSLDKSWKQIRREKSDEIFRTQQIVDSVLNEIYPKIKEAAINYGSRFSQEGIDPTVKLTADKEFLDKIDQIFHKTKMTK